MYVDILERDRETVRETERDREREKERERETGKINSCGLMYTVSF